MKLDELKTGLAEYLSEKNLKLYDLTYSKKDNILTVVLDESLDLNAISKISEDVSAYMDEHDGDMDAYLLSVETAGIERKIRNEQEVADAVGSYVYVKTGNLELNGDLKDYKDGILTLAYKDKNLNKKAEIAYKDIKFIRYAVKF